MTEVKLGGCVAQEYFAFFEEKPEEPLKAERLQLPDLSGLEELRASCSSVARRKAEDVIRTRLDGEYLENINPRQGQGIAYKVRLGTRPLPEETATVFPAPKAVGDELRANGHGDADDDELQRHDDEVESGFHSDALL